MGPLAQRKVFDDPTLMPGHFAFQRAQQRGTLVCQEQSIAAPIGGPAFHQPAVFEFVDHGNDGGAIQMSRVGQRLLGQSGILPDDHQDAEQSGRDADFADSLGEIGEDRALRKPQLIADQAGQHAESGRLASARCRAICGVARLFDVQRFASHNLPSIVDYRPPPRQPVNSVSVTVTVADLNQSVPAEEGQTVLDALLAHGVGFAYSCQAGNCGTCRCELVSGEIMELEYSEHALSAEERSRGIVLACRSQVWSDVVVRRLDAEDFVVHPSRVMRCKVVDLTALTHDILRLRMDIIAGGPFAFSAGQFASLEFPVAPGVVRDYSMANRPDEKRLEFHIRVMPSANSVSRRMAATLKPGDLVKVTGPLGMSYLRAQHAGPMLCIAGGSGLAPIKSIVETALGGGFGQPVHLYFGVRAERDVYFEAELAELQRRFASFRAHIVLSEPGGEASATLLPRRRGLVTEAVAADFPALAGFKAYFAGPPPMVDAASVLVRERGVEARDIHADAFFPAATAPKQMAEMR